MKSQLKQNIRLTFAGVLLLFVATVASVKADLNTGTTSAKSTVQVQNFGTPVPVCGFGVPCK